MDIENVTFDFGNCSSPGEALCMGAKAAVCKIKRNGNTWASQQTESSFCPSPQDYRRYFSTQDQQDAFDYGYKAALGTYRRASGKHCTKMAEALFKFCPDLKISDL